MQRRVTQDKGRDAHIRVLHLLQIPLSQRGRKYAANIIMRRRQTTFDGLMRPRNIKVFIACKR